jgi:hypothetical protein
MSRTISGTHRDWHGIFPGRHSRKSASAAYYIILDSFNLAANGPNANGNGFCILLISDEGGGR